MAREQVRRWALEHPTCPKNGNFFEVPFLSYTGPRVLGVMALAGAIWYSLPMVTWNKKPATLSEDFIAEVKAKGRVAQRMNGPPVYLNPFANRIPGGVTGPEDLKEALE